MFQVSMLEFGLLRFVSPFWWPRAEPSHEPSAHISKIFWDQGARFRPCSSLLEGWATLGLKEKRSELVLVFPRLKGKLPHLWRLGAAGLSSGQQLLLVKIMVVFTRKKLLTDSRKRSSTWAEAASEYPNVKINLKRTACKHLVVWSARPNENKGIYFSFCIYFHPYLHEKQLAVALKILKYM